MELLRVNTIKIVGRLTNVDIRTGNLKKNGKGYISAKATVVSNKYEFEVSFFANQETADGKPNQLYLSYSKMNELQGKKVEITGEIRENRYWSSTDEQMKSSQQLSGRFVRGVVDSTVDEATFEMGGFVVEELKEKTNKAGETYRYDLTLGQSNYSGNMMSKFVLHVNPSDREIINGVRGYHVGNTVKVNGNLAFVVDTVTTTSKNEGGFGEGVTRTFVNRQHNYFIQGGSAVITDGTSYPMDVVRTLVAAYKANDVALAEKAKSAGSSQPIEEAPTITRRQTSLI